MAVRSTRVKREGAIIEEKAELQVAADAKWQMP